MKNGFKIFWTDAALKNLADIIGYLEEKWTERELKNFATKLENILSLISQNPNLFQGSTTKNVRRAVITKRNTLYYRVINDTIEILLIYSNRKDPSDLKLK